jgi:hypothetical protein
MRNNNILSNNNSGGNNSNNDPSLSISNIVTNTAFSSGNANGTPDESNNTIVKGEVQDMGTTVFIDNAQTAVKDESQVAHMDPSWFKMNDTQQTEQSIKDFLAKPLVISSGNLTVADTLTSILWSPMPATAFGLGTGELWTQKLAGYFGIRMDMRFRLVVNANRFQQGRYILAWVPTGGMNATTAENKSRIWRETHLATLVQRTTVPHVELDISSQTSCELLVPFSSCHTFYPLNAVSPLSYTGTLGFINLYPYSPLVAPTGSTVASFSLYVSFENVTLFGASSPQSGLRGTEREISNSNNGPISGIATSFARGFNEFANIPLLSSYAKGAAWISDRIAKSAKIFGFSKPVQGDSLTKMILYNNPGHSHIDGDSDARALSYLSKPSTIPVDGLSGTNYDEMDFSYVGRKFAWFQTTNWTTGSSGTLTNIDVSPLKALLTGEVFHYTPVGFLANMFQNWRGSLKFRFKFVKTEFHSGRLQFAFFPTDEIASNILSPQYVNRHVVDVREFNEFTFEIPYIARRAWKDRAEITGVLSIRVVDALVAPSSVSSTVPILIEIAAGDDFQLSIPSSITQYPITAVPQSGLSDPDKITMDIGNTSILSDPTAASAFTQGDKVSNFRALLKRFYTLQPNTKTAGNTIRPTLLNVSVVPDVIPILAPANAAQFVYADVISTIASCYTYWGGGIRIKDVVSCGLSTTPAINSSSKTMTATFVPITGSSLETDAFINSSSNLTLPILSHQVYQDIFLNNSVTIEVPQYTKSLKRCIPDLWLSKPLVPDTTLYYTRDNATQGLVRFTLPVGQTPAAPIAGYDIHNIFRSLADDGEFSLFISIVPIIGAVSPATSGVY